MGMDKKEALKILKNEKYPVRLISAIMVAIESLEKELSDNWIPISERLPTREEYNKNDGRFIVTDGNRVYQSLFDVYEKKCFLDVIYKGNCNYEEIIDNRVIAWQSLPEPYRGDGDMEKS